MPTTQFQPLLYALPIVLLASFHVCNSRGRASALTELASIIRLQSMNRANRKQQTTLTSAVFARVLSIQ